MNDDEEMDNKALRNVIRELSKIVPSSHLVSTGFLLDLLNSPYNEMWFQCQKKVNGSLPYIGHNTNDKIDNAEEILYSICQGLMTQGINELYYFIVFLIKSYLW